MMSKLEGARSVFVKYSDMSLIPDSIGPLREKYEEVERRILEDGIASRDEFAPADKAEYRDLLLAHDKSYVDEFMELKHTPRIIFSGLPLDASIRELFLVNTGATILTLELAIENGLAMCIGGGSVHAHRSQGIAFCLINDVAVALLRAKALKQIDRAALICCQHNQADGVASILSDYPNLYTFSIFEKNSYPFAKVKGDLDIVLADGVGDFQYLAMLKDGLRRVYDEHRPDAVIYIAGSSPFAGDSTSKLEMSMEGLRERDEIIIRGARERGIAVAVLISATFDPEDQHSVAIHLNTARVVKEHHSRGRT
jgi:acetoin utilization deacetylase AcuC-like enzyme